VLLPLFVSLNLFRTGFHFDEDEDDLSGDPPPRLCAGYCSRMGPRSSNEDRCVAFTDLFYEVNQFMSSHSHDHIAFYGDDRGPNWRELAAPTRSHSHTDAYFGVYDGHSGATASQFLHNVLHHSIYS
jgi:serine/threonine protein phosphatase PrpC